MAKQKMKKLDPFHWHEALDRSLLAAEFFSENVARHAVVRSQARLRREAEAISERMFQLYQSLGAMTLRAKKCRR